jgi:hypothetical protein
LQGSIDRVAAYDCIVRQNAFVNAIAVELVLRRGLSAELRIGCGDDGSENSIALNLWTSQGSVERPAVEIEGIIRRIKRLLPDGFGWSLQTAGSDFSEDTAAPSGWKDAKWRISRIVRRLDVVDLPMRPDDSVSRPVWQPAGLGRTEGFRVLPSVDADLTEMDSNRLCLPCPGPMAAWLPRPKTLFEELLRSGPAFVSMTLHPIASDQIETMRNTALSWKRFVDASAGRFAQTGLIQEQAFAKSYGKFELPSDQLCQLSIRVAARCQDFALAVADVLSALLGGRQAFEATVPTRDCGISTLADRWVDFPTTPNARAHMARMLAATGVQRPSSDVLDFLWAFPHVYALSEALEAFGLPIADEEGLSGLDGIPIAPFARPSLVAQRPKDKNRIRLGCLEPNRYHTIPLNDLTKHALIVGSTGSGKTLTTNFMARELHKHQVPFLVIEPVKTEYYQSLRGCIPSLRRYRFEASETGKVGKDYLAFDPLRVPAGVTVSRHVGYLKSCFEAAFPLDALMSLLLESGLMSYYTSPVGQGGCEWPMFTRGHWKRVRISEDGKEVFPSFATFVKHFLNTFLKEAFPENQAKASSLRVDVQRIFQRRFDNLQRGLLGESFQRADKMLIAARADDLAKGRTGSARLEPSSYDPLGSLLNVQSTQPAYNIVELDAITDGEQKSLVMAFLLSWLFEARQAEDCGNRQQGNTRPDKGLRHVVIIEEAHRLLAASATGKTRGGDLAGESAKAKAVSLFVDMLAEIRAFGQGIVIVEQIPSKIVVDAIKNTNLKIMLRLTAKDDRDYLGDAMNLTEEQKRFVGTLSAQRGRGIRFVAFEEGLDQPVLLYLPLPTETGAN